MGPQSCFDLYYLMAKDIEHFLKFLSVILDSSVESSLFRSILLMLEGLWGTENTPALLVGVQAVTTPLDISMVISQKNSKQPSSRPSKPTFGYIPKGCSSTPQGHLLKCVHSSIVCHSQNLETT